jgi:hypothetical protein
MVDMIPKYCPRKTSRDMPLKKAHKRCPFRSLRRSDGKVVCSCPSAIRYMATHGVRGTAMFSTDVICIA